MTAIAVEQRRRFPMIHAVLSPPQIVYRVVEIYMRLNDPCNQIRWKAGPTQMLMEWKLYRRFARGVTS